MGKKAREKRLRGETGAASSPQPVQRQAAGTELPWQTTASGPASGAGGANWQLGAGLFVLALLVRGLFLFQLSGTPYTEVENIDTKGYIAWAQQILGGEWLPGRHFYQSPLYAYYLAAVYAVSGVGHWTPRILQALVGSASVWLVYQIGTQVFSRRVGVIAALMLCVYGPLIAEEIMLAKTALVIFLTLLSMYLFLRAQQQQDQRGMFVAGVAFGVAVIGVGQWLPVLLGLVIYLASSGRGRWLQRRRLVAALLGGAAAIMLPLILWNSYWGGGLMLSSGDAGLNLFIGNNPLTTGLPGRPANLRDLPWFEEEDSKRLAEQDAGRTLTPAQVSQHWSRRAMGWAVSHPGDFLGVLFKKTVVMWNSFEIPDSYQYNFLRAHFLPWLWGCLNFAIVGPLALTGLLLVSAHRPARPLYVACLAYMAVTVLFYVRSRYRLPAVPLLIVFAAAAIDWLIIAVRQRQWQSIAAGAVALLATAALVNHTYCEAGRSKAPAICLGGDAWFDLEWMKLAEWRQDKNDLEGTAAYLYRAAQGESQRGLGSLYFWLGYVEYRISEQKRAANDAAAAAQHLVSAEQAYGRVLNDGYRPGPAHFNLALVYRAQNRLDLALQSIETAAGHAPADPDILLRATQYRAERGDCAEAERWRIAYERVRPGDAAAQRAVEGCQNAKPPAAPS